MEAKTVSGESTVYGSSSIRSPKSILKQLKGTTD